ncbi:unnamed protein product, partial [Ectocarpus fasciculatus]
QATRVYQTKIKSSPTTPLSFPPSAVGAAIVGALNQHRTSFSDSSAGENTPSCLLENPQHAGGWATTFAKKQRKKESLLLTEKWSLRVALLLSCPHTPNSHPENSHPGSYQIRRQQQMKREICSPTEKLPLNVSVSGGQAI